MSKTLRDIVIGDLTLAFQRAFPAFDFNATPLEVTQSTNPAFGHYQCNSAMKLTKLLGMPPRSIAAQVIPFLDNHPHLEGIEIAGPGFINLRLKTDFLSSQTKLVLANPKEGLEGFVGHKLVIDFSSPNVAKEMHVGHLRSTIIGDAIARCYEFLGFEVLRLNHIGDWGTAFGMLIAFLKAEHPEVMSGQTTSTLPELMQWYRASKKRFDEDADFKQTSQNEVVRLQGGDPESLRAWKIICDISERAYNEIYDLLDVHLTTRGESFYNPYLAGVVADLKAKGIAIDHDGAQCVFLEGYKNREGEALPLIVQKTDGGYNYATTDIACLKHRLEVEKADEIIIVLDSGQSTHLSMVFETGRLAHYWDPAKTPVTHVGFGLVLGADGKKFKTRSGDTERLIDLLNFGLQKAEEVINAREHKLTPDEQKSLAKVLGINAIKYADLSNHRINDYSFSYEKMLQFEGNTAAYLMYANVRAGSILRKVGQVIDPNALTLSHPTEIDLALHCCQFAEMLLSVKRDLLPHRLCDYLFELANRFNAFFRDCRVEGVPEQASRLVLCQLTQNLLETGMGLLGLKVVKVM